MVRAGRSAEALPLLNSAQQDGKRFPSRRESLVWTMQLCCVGMILYVASSGLAAEHEREVRVKVNEMSKSSEGAPGAAASSFSSFSSSPSFSSSARGFIDDELLRDTSETVHAELRELDAAGAFPEAEETKKEGDAALPDPASRSTPEIPPVKATQRQEDAVAALAGATQTTREGEEEGAEGAEGDEEATARVRPSEAEEAAAAEEAEQTESQNMAAASTEAGPAAGPTPALTASSSSSEEEVNPPGDASFPTTHADYVAPAPAPAVAATVPEDDAPAAAAALAAEDAPEPRVIDPGVVSTTLVYDAAMKLSELQLAAAAEGSASVAPEVDSVMRDLEVGLTASVVDPVTGAVAEVPPYLNGGFPHHVMVQPPSEAVKKVSAFVGETPSSSSSSSSADASEGLASEQLAPAPEPAPEELEHVQEPEAEGDGPEPAEDGLVRELVGAHAEPDLGRPWPTRVVTVWSVYDEWDDADEIPAFANNSADPSTFPDAPRAVGYTVAPMYQRRHPDMPGYVPNHGYEGGAYLKFIVDYYDNLPDVVVFLQADAVEIDDLAGKLAAVVADPDAVTYQPVNVGNDRNLHDVYIYKRDPYQEWWSLTSLRGIEQCWRAVAGWFGHGWAADEVPQVSLYCCNYFAVSKANVRRVPKDVWEKAYDQLIVKGECVEGAGPVVTRDDDKWQIAITLEHLAHVIYGGYFPHFPRQCGGEFENSAFRDQCCDGTTCGASGGFEDIDWLAEGGAKIVSDPPTVLKRPPDDLPEDRWAEQGGVAAFSPGLSPLLSPVSFFTSHSSAEQDSNRPPPEMSNVEFFTSSVERVVFNHPLAALHVSSFSHQSQRVT